MASKSETSSSNYKWTIASVDNTSMYVRISDINKATNKDTILSESYCNSINEILEEIDSKGNEVLEADFMQMARKVKRHQNQGLFPSRLIPEIRKFTSKKYGSEREFVRYEVTLDVLNGFRRDVEDHKPIFANPFYPKLPKILEFLENKNAGKEVYAKYCGSNGGKFSDISIDISIFKKYDIAGIVEFMKVTEETGILSWEMLCRFNRLAEMVIELRVKIDRENKKLRSMGEKYCKLKYPEVFSNANYKQYISEELELSKKPVSDDNLQFIRNILESHSNKVHESETKLKETGKDSKKKICKSEHVLPFCSNCGWRSSWTKAFKKRGVYVKEVVSDTEENIWHHNVKSYII